MRKSVEHLPDRNEGNCWTLQHNDAARVDAFIEKHDLKPLTKEKMSPSTPVKLKLPKDQLPKDQLVDTSGGHPPKIGYAGGMDVPHLHYGDKIYVLKGVLGNQFQENIKRFDERLTPETLIRFGEEQISAKPSQTLKKSVTSG